MIKLTVPLPKQITIACSGGVDSMAVVDFLSHKHKVTIAHFNHRTQNGEKAAEFVSRYCSDNNIVMLYGSPRSQKGSKESQEEYWRRERYEFLSELGPVITCHHLDDCVETYIWSSLHGTPKVIPLTRNNVLRPFLTTRKSEFTDWCVRKGLEWCEDLSNEDERYTRNYIRKNLVPHALHVNPGLHKTVKKIIEKQY
jgi:tRNA(Ile)-lysidine synthetase-like protein